MVEYYISAFFIIYLHKLKMNRMGVFNAIGGVIFGTIVLSILWFIIISALKESSNGKSKTDGTGIVIMSFIVMILLLLFKCSSK